MGRNNRPIEKTTLGTRLYFIVPGSSFIVFSIAAVLRGVWWIPGFSQKFGRGTMTPSLAFGGLGFILLAIGLFPWNRLSKNRNARKR